MFVSEMEGVYMNSFNKKPKGEQFFILIMLLIFVGGVFCTTGCLGRACAIPACGIDKRRGVSSDFNFVGCSFPGCGGCITSGVGCNTILWPQSVSIVHGSEKGEESYTKITACDISYYGLDGCSGCIACGVSQKDCYGGCLKSNEGDNINVIFYGKDTDSLYYDEYYEREIGCINGCIGCFNKDYYIGNYIGIIEENVGLY